MKKEDMKKIQLESEVKEDTEKKRQAKYNSINYHYISNCYHSNTSSY